MNINPELIPYAGVAAFIALISAAVMILVRDISASRQAAIGRRIGEPPSASLQTLPPTADAWIAKGLTGRIDRWFVNLVTNTGLGLTPLAGMLLAIFWGVLIGGAVWVWRNNFIPGAVGMMLGMIATLFYFAYVRARRMAALREQLPDVMELLARAVRAGESLDQALTLAGETIAEPLGTEFRRCSRQLEMGLSMSATMRALARRVPIGEVRILAATFMVQRQTGGNLPITLERLAAVIRDRISYHRQFRASTASGRISTIMIAMAGPLVACYFIFFQTDYIRRFIELPVGLPLLGAAIILQIIGLTWIYSLLRSDY